MLNSTTLTLAEQNVVNHIGKSRSIGEVLSARQAQIFDFAKRGADIQLLKALIDAEVAGRV